MRYLAGLLLGTVGVLSLMGLRGEAVTSQSATTDSGFHVEEVRVGTSCVVIVSRKGSGTSDYIAAVPCSAR
jgi:hypothetical protein